MKTPRTLRIGLLWAVVLARTGSALAAPAESMELASGRLSVQGEPGEVQVTFNGQIVYRGAESGLSLGPRFQLDGADVVLLETYSGGTACPALYRVIAVSQDRTVWVSPEFGTCSDLPRVRQEGTRLVIDMPRLRSPGSVRYAYSEKTVFENGKPLLPSPELAAPPSPTTTAAPSLQDRFKAQQAQAQQAREYIDRHVVLYLCQNDRERATGREATIVQGNTAVPWVHGFTIAVDTRVSRYAYCNHCWITESRVIELQQTRTPEGGVRMGGVTRSAVSSYTLGSRSGRTPPPQGPVIERFNEVSREGDTLIFEGINPRRMELNLKTSEIFVQTSLNAAVQRSQCKQKNFWDQRTPG